MASLGQRGLFLIAFAALLTGVMAEALDTDLIGVVVAAVCIGILTIVIIGLLAYCCFRRISGADRNSVLGRKDSGSVSTSVTPRWVPTIVPSTMPVYSLPPEPMLYTLPPPHYYLGHYTPKFIDAERMHYMNQHPHRREAEEEHARRVHEREEEAHVQETPIMVQVAATSQPNGHVVQDFSASSINYRVIRKQHKHEKMPDWLRKTYGENEMSMDMGEEGSRASSVRSTKALVTPQTPAETVRAQVSPRHSRLDSQDVLHISQDFTIVDYVEPQQQQRPPSAYRPNSAADGDEYRITTTTVTATTSYASQRHAADVSHGSGSTYVPPASTSTPRAPPPVGEAEEDEHGRMRKPGEGSVPYPPDTAEGRADVRF